MKTSPQLRLRTGRSCIITTRPGQKHKHPLGSQNPRKRLEFQVPYGNAIVTEGSSLLNELTRAGKKGYNTA